MATYTTADLLTSIRNRAALPSTTNSNNTNSDANLLKMATEELHIKILPLILSVREEIYVRIEDVAITAGQAEYEIPSRASGMVLRDLQIVQGSAIFSLPPVDSEYISTTGQGTPEGYYLRHNQIVLYPAPSTTADTLRIRYYLRPSRLVRTVECAQITAIDTGTRQVTVNSAPASWSAASVVDLVKKTVPYVSLEIDKDIQDLTANVFTFAALPTGLAVGDWISLADETPIPQVPQEFQPVLAQMTVVKALEANGDREGSTAAWKDLQTNIEQALKLITPRVHGERKKVISRIWR